MSDLDGKTLIPLGSKLRLEEIETLRRRLREEQSYPVEGIGPVERKPGAARTDGGRNAAHP
jgi:hypothetical protein